MITLLEAVRRYSRRRLLRPIERRLEKAMRKAFLAQGRLFGKRFARLKGQFEEAVSLDDLDPLFILAELATLELFTKPLNRAAKAALGSGAKALIAELDVSISFSLSHPRAAAYLEAVGAELVSKINDTTRSYIRTLVKNAVEEGWSYDRTAKALIQRYSEFAIGKPQEHIDSRAHLIAVTESANAYAEGHATVAGDLEAAGLAMEKFWSTMGDSKVSDGCRENEDAGWIPNQQAFPSGHMHDPRFPGCRCEVVYRVSQQ